MLKDMSALCNDATEGHTLHLELAYIKFGFTLVVVAFLRCLRVFRHPDMLN